MVPPALIENRTRKLEVYRAFIQAYNEGHPTNLSNVAHRFDAENAGVLACAPSALITTAISRHFRTLRFTQDDFLHAPVRVVDPHLQRAVVRARDPNTNIAEEADIDDALQDAFDAGLLEVSDIGFDVTGQRAIFTFSFSCGMLCGHRGTAMMERKNQQWTLSPRRCGSTSVS
jgi:hypothetical protein